MMRCGNVRMGIACIYVLWGWSLISASATMRYVWQDSPDPGNGYATWDTAAHEIQSAVDAATDGDTVLVTNGVYLLTQEITILKGVTVRATAFPLVVIDGQDNTRCVWLGHSNAVLDGLVITRGSRYGSGNKDGGGVYIDGGGVVRNSMVDNCAASLSGGGIFMKGGGLVENTIIQYNHGDDWGGGIYCSGDAIVRNCQILANNQYGSGACDGGGVACYEGGLVENCRIWLNATANNGGGVAIVNGGTVALCDIANNQATNNGGGVYLEGEGTVRQCTISGNSTRMDYAVDTGRGGGAYVTGGDSAILDRCMVKNNRCGDRGGGVAVFNRGYVYSCLITGNRATYYGGGIDCDQWATILNCTVVSNQTGEHAGGMHTYGAQVTVFNTIVDFNTDPMDENILVENDSVFRNCCSRPLVAGTGNLGVDPLFAGRPGGNYRLQSGSPCIDHGFNYTIAPNLRDLAGKPRVRGAEIDMGAYEYGAASLVPLLLLGQ